MRFPNQRLAQLFLLLQNETLPQDELANRLGVSTRTVRADITALNALLEQNGARFVLNRGEGYQLSVEDPKRYALLCESQTPQLKVPRTGPERVNYLLVRFLTSAWSLKLEDLSEEWFVSRATLQNDMAEVREHFNRYNLTIETRPRHGMKLFGSEMALRACLTDLLWELSLADGESSNLFSEAISGEVMDRLAPRLNDSFSRHQIRITDEGARFICLYCAVAVRRIGEGFPLPEFRADDSDEAVRLAAHEIAREVEILAGKPLSSAEEQWLQVHISARRIQDVAPSAINADDEDALVNYILRYINQHYNYNLLNDEQLHADLLTHIRTMITRVRYQIHIPNPLLDNIKQHYPMAYDMTLAAVSSWGKYTPYSISENEIGFLVLHIGVGLERHYNIGYQRQPHVLLVCDTGNSTVRMIQAMLLRKYPQLEVTRIITLRDYEQLTVVEEDFVISTARIPEIGKPVVVMSPFPTDYQLEQIGKLVLVDRTRPYILNKYFDAQHFMVVREPIDQQTLFERLCEQLQREGYVGETFLHSVTEREAIVSTMFGDGIALPHSLGLMADKTVVYTVLAPEGITWGAETAHVIFLLAISKQEYEEAMAIYELFVTFLRERAVTRLRDCGDFASFHQVAMECLTRF
ncbi:transcription antiterminator BglG [Salmonella enterica subsp. enterica serovar Choleraesuis]|nr:transcription antiterminator BglG [Salmonella enterica subsp. enterica serovar Choleraesuis]